MRYICLKPVVTKIFDGIIEDAEDIQNVLEQLKNKEVTCSVQIKNGPVHDFSRLVKFDKTSVTWKIIEGSDSLVKMCPISHISLIKVLIDEELMIRLKPNPSKWSSLDISDDA